MYKDLIAKSLHKHLRKISLGSWIEVLDARSIRYFCPRCVLLGDPSLKTTGSLFRPCSQFFVFLCCFVRYSKYLKMQFGDVLQYMDVLYGRPRFFLKYLHLEKVCIDFSKGMKTHNCFKDKELLIGMTVFV